jgi:hypothetical protein
MKDKKESLEETLKTILTKLTSKIDDYGFYNNFLFNAEEIMDTIFGNYIETIEGGCCCRDKSGFIVGRIKKALKERKCQSLSQSYKEYKDNGGDLGGIDETNTDLNELCYWCPKTLKNTDEAISLFFELLNLGKVVRKQRDLQTENEQLKQQLAEIKKIK